MQREQDAAQHNMSFGQMGEEEQVDPSKAEDKAP